MRLSLFLKDKTGTKWRESWASPLVHRMSTLDNDIKMIKINECVKLLDKGLLLYFYTSIS